MSTTQPNGHRRSAAETRHCKEDALSSREFERLYEATYRIDDDYFARESRFILFTAGRLGLRSGEITHFRESWVDWRRQMIEIPSFQQCTDGRDGGICGSCEQAAQQMTEYNPGLDIEAARDCMWQPKTGNAAREVPFDTSPRAAMALESYFDHYDHFQASQTGVNRRVDRMAHLADGVDAARTYPHCLRATAASTWAARGLGAVALKSLMGWSDFSVALNYIEESGERTAKAMQRITK